MDDDRLMNSSRFRFREIWLPKLCGRTTFLLMGTSLFILYFYLLGNMQGFTDRTLIILFDIEFRILSLTAVAGFLSAITTLATLPISRKLELLPIILSLLATVLSLILYLGIALLQAFLDGYAVS